MNESVPIRTRRPRRGTPRVLAMPLAIFLATCAGLVLGLTGDGLPDYVAWVLLSLPLLAITIAWRRRASPITTSMKVRR